jgi:choline dehydrogenase-like flavoprotein
LADVNRGLDLSVFETTADSEEADLVVVGFGGAGAACAIAAADHGGSVVVLENQPEDRHTPAGSRPSTPWGAGMVSS